MHSELWGLVNTDHGPTTIHTVLTYITMSMLKLYIMQPENKIIMIHFTMYFKRQKEISKSIHISNNIKLIQLILIILTMNLIQII